MKLLTIVLIFVSTICYAQNEALKGNTKIVVKTNLTASQNYDLVTKTLLSEDYFIETKDISNFYIKTQTKNIKSMGVYFLNILSKDNEIQLSGMTKSSMEINVGGVTAKMDYESIVYRGMKGSFYRLGFDAMNNLASKFNGEVSYK